MSASIAAAASGVNGLPPPDETQVSNVNVGLGFTSGLGFDDRGQGHEASEHQMTSVDGSTPPPTLHPYVSSFFASNLV